MKKLLSIALASVLIPVSGCQTISAPEAKKSQVPQPQFAALSVADAEAMAEWYESSFGLERRETTRFPDGVTIQVGGEDLWIEIVQHEAARTRADFGVERDFYIHGIYKIGFFVEDLEATIERLTNMGVEFRGRLVEFPEHGIRTILVLDPEGNIVQLFEPID